jgi:hypothetical protein
MNIPAGKDETKHRNSLLLLAEKLSKSDSQVTENVSLYCQSPETYFDKLDEYVKECCSIESPNDISPVQVLVTALNDSGFIVIADNRSEPAHVLKLLNKLSNLTLEKSNLYVKLMGFFESAPYGFGSYFNAVEHYPTTFDCAKSVGLQLLAINDDSDSLLLFLCEASEKENIINLAKKANINLHMEKM